MTVKGGQITNRELMTPKEEWWYSLEKFVFLNIV